MNNELKVENLYFKTILNDINFNLNPGTIAALMGKSGSGKTVLLKILYGLLNYSGTITIDNNLVADKNKEDIRKNIGLYLNLNILEEKYVYLNLIEPLKNLDYSQSKIKKNIEEITKRLGIENLLYKETNSLSYSQKKIVAFAQSIIYEPKLILIDNLFDSLDTYYKNKIIAYFKYLIKSKKAIIIFTTNNKEDLLFSDNLLVLKSGKLSISGTVKELIKDENIFIKNNIKLPFIIDLSYKLKAYELIDKLIFDTDEMVEELWK